MQNFSATLFYQIARTLELSARAAQLDQHSILDEKRRGSIKSMMTDLRDRCPKVGLRLSGMYAETILMRVENQSFTSGELAKELHILQDRMQDEMKNELFLHIDGVQSHLYIQSTPLFGMEVADRFPSAITDIEEAGKCLALGRGTASVFHLMRVMEVCLKSLAKGLDIPYAPSWESYLNQIETRIIEKHQKKSHAWKKSEPFYRDASGDLQMVKIAWRNPTMHIVRTYTPEEADGVYRAVRAFMQRLSTRFTQAGPIKINKSSMSMKKMRLS
jgi:hypothetical protein